MGRYHRAGAFLFGAERRIAGPLFQNRQLSSPAGPIAVAALVFDESAVLLNGDAGHYIIYKVPVVADDNQRSLVPPIFSSSTSSISISRSLVGSSNTIRLLVWVNKLGQQHAIHFTAGQMLDGRASALGVNKKPFR